MTAHSHHADRGDSYAGPFIGRFALVLRSLRFAGLLLLGIALLPSVPFIGRRSHALARWWHGRLLGILNIRLEIDGERPAGAVLIVSNHCSWLDIIVLGHVFDAAFISKSEVGGWPLIGAFARASGTLFLSRGTGKTRETTQQIMSMLESGRSVLLFPEGTTTLYPQPRRFHARLFAAAIEGDFPVLPLALRYCDASTPADMHHALAPWVDEADLGPHFRDLFRLRGLTAQLRLCATIEPAGYDRRGLAEASQLAITHRQTTAAARHRSCPQSCRNPTRSPASRSAV